VSLRTHLIRESVILSSAPPTSERKKKGIPMKNATPNERTVLEIFSDYV
jgi:hypothetical protein